LEVIALQVPSFQHLNSSKIAIQQLSGDLNISTVFSGALEQLTACGLGQPIRFIEVFDSYIDRRVLCSDVFTCVYLHKSLVVPRDRVKHAPLESFLIMDSIWNVTPESLVTWVGVLGSENGDRPDSARSADLKAQVRIHFQLFFKFSGTNARSLTGLSLYSSELFSLNQCPLK
jgi:hypothetical protein